MRTILVFLFLFTFSLVKGQAHLGSTEYAIKGMFPEKRWTSNYTKNGTRYISADIGYGNYTYYFDKETNLSDFCIQIPASITALNAQVELYNKKYVITSETSWTAYLEQGGIMYIKLIYSEELKASYFTYSNTK
jgi:hypothetical protein